MDVDPPEFSRDRDAGFRGPVTLRFTNIRNDNIAVTIGARKR